MGWKISFEKKAEKQLDKLAREARLQITSYIFQRVAVEPDPRLVGKALAGNLKGYWRYRVGDHPIICEVKNRELLILVIQVGHRSKVYK